MTARMTVLSAALCCAAGVAHAGTLSTYNVNNQAGSMTLGSVTIDSTAGVIESFDVAVNAGGASVTFDGAPTQQGFYPYLDDYRAVLTSGSYELIFSLAATTLEGYAPADKASCSKNAVNCDYLASVFDGPISSADLQSTFEGDLAVQPTASSVTPEPGSFLLFGTGMLGMAARLRRRRA